MEIFIRLPGRLRVVCAGEHFPAGFRYLQKKIEERQLQEKIELLRAPTTNELMRIASTTHVALPFMERFSSDFIEKSQNMLVIHQHGVGLEGVDIEAATNHGIAVCNVPGKGTTNAEATAEHALLLTMMLLRSTQSALPECIQSRQLGGWPLPHTLCEQRVTVVGYGSVGQTLCHYLTTLGAHVTAVRRSWDTISENDQNLNVKVKKSTDLEVELPTTNVLILCCSLTPETFHLLNSDRLQLLKRGAYVVNVGRGPLVDYHTIRSAIESEHVAGFASDVGVGHPSKPAEPWDPHDPLSLHPHTIFTPHVGGNCDLVVRKTGEVIIANLERILMGLPPHHWANRQQ